MKAFAVAPDELTEEEVQAVGALSLCCCAVVMLAIAGVVVWIVRRKKPATSRSSQLTVFAIALEPQAREIIEDQLQAAGVSPVPTTPGARARLVRETARLLLTVQPSWRQFGYGEKPGLQNLAAAEQAYRTASDDFRGRSQAVTPGDDGLVVLSLLICSTRTLAGVSRLDDPSQVRRALEDRLRVTEGELLGAELLWAPSARAGGVTEAEIALRFPEMLPLNRPGN